jgi:FemAB-related protein (PEP-CTERM system-associated)
MQIVECDDARREVWNQFVNRHPEATFYHRFEWRSVNRTCFGHGSAYLGAFEDDWLVGIFPIVQVKSRLFGNIACSMPFVNYGGPCADRADVEAALLDEAARVVERWGCKYLEIRSIKDLGARFPSSERKVSMALELDPNPDTLWNAFKHGHRQAIRKGQKGGFVTKFGGADLIDDFYTLLAESWRDLGTPIYAKSYFDAVVRAFGPYIRVTVVYHDGRPIATAMDGIHRDTVEGMWLAQRMAYRNQNVGYLLYWDLIRNACERGFRHFHLGRSTANSGGEMFKKKWNAEARQLYWHYILQPSQSIPALNVDNPKYRLAIETWRRLPIGLTTMIGPSIARSIP